MEKNNRGAGYVDGKFRIKVCLLIAISLLPCSSKAQWATQTIPLQPGWNAVQLLVQPAQDDCSIIFTNLPVDQVQWWKKEDVGMEFELDPAELFPRVADWRYWFATNTGSV